MKEIKNIDEVSLWHTCFPNFTPVSEALGVYTMRSEKDMLKRIGYIRGMDEKLKALLTLEMSCAVLWPYVEDLFCCDFFPHILAAATDILRATDFGESALITQKYLVQELIDALNNCEKVFEGTYPYDFKQSKDGQKFLQDENTGKKPVLRVLTNPLAAEEKE